MNTSEAAAILRLVAAATGQMLDRYAPDAWALVLDDVDPADAKLAVRAIARRPQPRDRRLVITPDMVLAEVRRIRRERIAAAEDAFTPSPAAREDPAAYLAELRAHRQAAAAGTLPATPDCPRLASRPGLAGDLRALSQHLGVTPAAELADDRRAQAEHANIPPTTGDQP